MWWCLVCSCHTWRYPPPAAKCFRLNFSVCCSIKAFYRPSCIFCKKSFQLWCNCNHRSLTYTVLCVPKLNWKFNYISLTSLTLVSLLNWFWLFGPMTLRDGHLIYTRERTHLQHRQASGKEWRWLHGFSHPKTLNGRRDPRCNQSFQNCCKKCCGYW